MEKISVIIPVYKVEEFLAQSVESVLNQTYQNLEIILVDDGSPDNCPKICDEYAKLDKRVKVIHKENGGLSDARNKGIEIATGDYFVFLDSDDTIHTSFCEILLNEIKRNDADIAMCKVTTVDDHSKDKKHRVKNISSQLFDSGYEIFDLLFNKKIQYIMLAGGKMYKREFFDTLRYPAGKIHEDEFVIHELLDNCKKAVYIDEPFFNYLLRKSGITGQNFSKKRLHGVEAKYNRVKYVEKYRPEFCDKALNQYLNTLILYYYKSKRAGFEENILVALQDEIKKLDSMGVSNFALKLHKKAPKILGWLLKIKYK